MAPSLNIAVAIPTSGRPDLIAEVVLDLSRQSRPPDTVVIAPAAPGDVNLERLAQSPFPVVVAEGPRGLCAQRNTLIRRLDSADVILFLDDDFLMAPGYVEACAAAFADHPDVVMATGHVIEDGSGGPGLTLERARELIAGDYAAAAGDVTDVPDAFGCNMAVRAETVRGAGLWFDERLPLYGWLEDLDFSRRLAAHGRIVKCESCRGVHMGTKHGKGSGVKLGYSQVANPLHLRRKGLIGVRRSGGLIARNLTANFGKLAFAEPWIDRRGRAWGNLLALGDLARGRLDPARIERLG